MHGEQRQGNWTSRLPRASAYIKSARESDLKGTMIIIYSGQKSGGTPLRSFALISQEFLLKN